MRLFEVEDRSGFDNDLAMILRNLRDRNDSQGSDPAAPIPWDSVNGLISNLGYGPVNEKVMASLVQKYPALNDIIKTFDQTGITLASDNEVDNEPTDIPTGPSVDDMAAAGAKDFQNKLS